MPTQTVPVASGKKPASQLSSGIMGMKFMRNSAQSTTEPETATKHTPLLPPKEVNKFEHEKDPGAWSMPESIDLKTINKHDEPKIPTNIGYADIFSVKPSAGRMTFGKKPAPIKAEEMAKGSKAKLDRKRPGQTRESEAKSKEKNHKRRRAA